MSCMSTGLKSDDTLLNCVVDRPEDLGVLGQDIRLDLDTPPLRCNYLNTDACILIASLVLT